MKIYMSKTVHTKKEKHIYLVIIMLLIGINCISQTPIITGDNLICPNDSGTVTTTTTYSNYQWYKRPFSSVTISAISGATSQNHVMDYSTYAASYISVEVVNPSGDTFISGEFFVDGWTFLNATVMSEGDFTVGPFGEAIICPGDTVIFSLMNPYNVNITWFLDGNPITGETQQQLIVTHPGDYYVTGAPAECPQLIQGPGTLLTLVDCTTSSDLMYVEDECRVWPVPTNNYLNIELPILSKFEGQMTIYNILGQRLDILKIQSQEILVDVSNYKEGIYCFVIEGIGDKRINGKFIKD